LNLLARTKRNGGLGAAAGITVALATLIGPMGLTEVFAGEGLPSVTTTIDSVKLNKAGAVTVTFTVVCGADGDSGGITSDSVSVKQSTGKFGQKVVSGSAGSDNLADCIVGDDPVTLTETVVADSGFFVSGKATVEATATVCSGSFCDSDSDEQAVKLKKS